MPKHGDELALAGGDILKCADDVSEEALNSKQSFEIWSVDNCAEVYSVNNALSNGASWDDLFINTKYFKNGEWASPCKNCKVTFENVYMPKKGN